MVNFDNNLKKYAQLAVEVGINIQPGQQLVINAPIESLQLVRYCVDAAYKAGASEVTTFFSDDYCSLSRYKNIQNKDYFDQTTDWLADGLTKGYKDGFARLVILGRNPTLLKDINPSDIARASRARSVAYKPLMDLVTSSHSQWSIISYATPEWAAQVFPNETIDVAIDKLWDAIFKSCRIDLDDPVKEWNTHNQNIHLRAKKMNDMKFDKLLYESSTSELMVGLADGHIWEGGSSPTQSGIMFNANIPTEEIFTTPHRNKVDGWIKSTKPLLYRGTMIDGIFAEFENGNLKTITSSSGEQVLKDMVSEDEGASHLGEIAIVPHSSPISQMNITFKETLFDENASCHFAFGQSYTSCMSVIEGESQESYKERGGNFSSVHTDWMVGSEDLKITGFKDGEKPMVIFQNGEWVI